MDDFQNSVVKPAIVRGMIELEAATLMQIENSQADVAYENSVFDALIARGVSSVAASLPANDYMIYTQHGDQVGCAARTASNELIVAGHVYDALEAENGFAVISTGAGRFEVFLSERHDNDVAVLRFFDATECTIPITPRFTIGGPAFVAVPTEDESRIVRLIPLNRFHGVVRGVFIKEGSSGLPALINGKCVGIFLGYNETTSVFALLPDETHGLEPLSSLLRYNMCSNKIVRIDNLTIMSSNDTANSRSDKYEHEFTEEEERWFNDVEVYADRELEARGDFFGDPYEHERIVDDYIQREIDSFENDGLIAPPGLVARLSTAKRSAYHQASSRRSETQFRYFESGKKGKLREGALPVFDDDLPATAKPIKPFRETPLANFQLAWADIDADQSGATTLRAPVVSQPESLVDEIFIDQNPPSPELLEYFEAPLVPLTTLTAPSMPVVGPINPFDEPAFYPNPFDAFLPNVPAAASTNPFSELASSLDAVSQNPFDDPEIMTRIAESLPEIDLTPVIPRLSRQPSVYPVAPKQSRFATAPSAGFVPAAAPKPNAQPSNIGKLAHDISLRNLAPVPAKAVMPDVPTLAELETLPLNFTRPKTADEILKDPEMTASEKKAALADLVTLSLAPSQPRAAPQITIDIGDKAAFEKARLENDIAQLKADIAEFNKQGVYLLDPVVLSASQLQQTAGNPLRVEAMTLIKMKSNLKSKYNFIQNESKRREADSKRLARQSALLLQSQQTVSQLLKTLNQAKDREDFQ